MERKGCSVPSTYVKWLTALCSSSSRVSCAFDLCRHWHPWAPMPCLHTHLSMNKNNKDKSCFKRGGHRVGRGEYPREALEGRVRSRTG